MSKVGDYVTYGIVDDSVLIIRSTEDRIRAFHNVCSRRGRRLAKGCGQVREFRCAYHAWRCDLDCNCQHVLDKADRKGALDNMTKAQRGMRSSGFCGCNPNPHQEAPISNFHRNLAKYMGRGYLISIS